MRTSLLLLLALVSVPRAVGADGDPLGPEFRVNTYTTLNQTAPDVAADATSGNFVVVWSSQNQDGSSYGIFGQRYAGSGDPLGPEFRVNSYTTDAQQRPSVALDSSGNFVVVWDSYAQDGSFHDIFGQRYADSGAPLGPEFRVNSYTSFDQGAPTVAADASGNFVVAWASFVDQDGQGGGVFAQRFAGSGAPLGPEFRVNSYTTLDQDTPAVAIDSVGNFVVAWASFSGQDGQGGGVFAQRYASSGAPLGAEFRVNTYTSFNQYSPSIERNAAGNFVVAWVSSDQDGYGRGIFGQRYASSGVPLGPEFGVNTTTTGFQYHPAVASSDADGNFVVIWQSLTIGTAYAVIGRRYQNSGFPFGPEFRVNTSTTDDRTLASVGADPLGNFVVVWASDLQDGSNRGVFGQRFSQMTPVELMHFRVE